MNIFEILETGAHVVAADEVLNMVAVWHGGHTVNVYSVENYFSLHEVDCFTNYSMTADNVSSLARDYFADIHSAYADFAAYADFEANEYISFLPVEENLVKEEL